MRHTEDFTGRRYGRLLVTKQSELKNKHHWRLWECACDCGGTVYTTAAKLRNGDSKSCGCWKKSFDLTGQRFGRLIVLENLGTATNWKTLQFRCRCDCGIEKTIAGVCLRRGLTKSCGCLRHQSPPNKTHGLTGTKIHRTWVRMLKRCTDPRSLDFPQYGGRGIRVCDRWMRFENFHADMGDVPTGKSLDRRNNELGYGPDNCRWATPTEQANNTRRNYLITAFERTQTLAEWARESGLRRLTIKARLQSGWLPERAVCEPVHSARILNNQSQV